MSVLLEDLVKAVELWMKLIRRKSQEQDYVDPNLDPVLLVPGIAGSILKSVDDKTGKEERVWVRIFSADHEFRTKLWSRFDASTGKTESLDPTAKIEVPEDRHGLYAIDVLDPDMLSRRLPFKGPSSRGQEKHAKCGRPNPYAFARLLSPTRPQGEVWSTVIGRDSVYYFHDMIVEMLKWGYQEGKTLFGFGYDFRQSNRFQGTLEGLATKLESAYNASGGKKVVLISHSMGGLLVKCFMALHNDIFEKYVKTWIAIAAPFRGAPGYVTSTIVNGMSFVDGWEQNFFVSKWSMHQLLIECPSIYELMACPDFQWQHPPCLEMWRKKCNNDGLGDSSVILESYSPMEAVPIFAGALSCNSASFGGVNFPLPFNMEILKWSNETRKVMESAKLPQQVESIFMEPISRHLTHYGSKDAPISDLSQLPYYLAKYVCVDGDGTVPVESAKADGLEAIARVGVPAEHRGILCERKVFRILKHWLKADHDPFYNPVNDYVILPTEFEIERHLEKGLEVTSLKEEWEIIEDYPEDADMIDEKPMVGSISVSRMGNDEELKEQVCATLVVHPQRQDKKRVELSAVSVSASA